MQPTDRQSVAPTTVDVICSADTKNGPCIASFPVPVGIAGRAVAEKTPMYCYQHIETGQPEQKNTQVLDDTPTWTPELAAAIQAKDAAREAYIVARAAAIKAQALIASAKQPPKPKVTVLPADKPELSHPLFDAPELTHGLTCDRNADLDAWIASIDKRAQSLASRNVELTPTGYAEKPKPETAPTLKTPYPTDRNGLTPVVAISGSRTFTEIKKADNPNAFRAAQNRGYNLVRQLAKQLYEREIRLSLVGDATGTDMAWRRSWTGDTRLYSIGGQGRCGQLTLWGQTEPRLIEKETTASVDETIKWWAGGSQGTVKERLRRRSLAMVAALSGLRDTGRYRCALIAIVGTSQSHGTAMTVGAAARAGIPCFAFAINEGRDKDGTPRALMGIPGSWKPAKMAGLDCWQLIPPFQIDRELDSGAQFQTPPVMSSAARLEAELANTNPNLHQSPTYANNAPYSPHNVTTLHGVQISLI